jgi:Papain family cysteine protease
MEVFMSTQESVLNAAFNPGYDPTVVEGGRSIRPVYAGAGPLPVSATVNPNFLPPVGAQGTSSQPGNPPTCAAWASTYGLATFTAAAASNQSPSATSQQASPAHIYIQVMQSISSTTCAGSLLTTYLDILTQNGTPNLATAPYASCCTKLFSSYNPNAAVDPSFQIPGWAAWPTTDLLPIKAVIANGGALCYGTALNQGFQGYNSKMPSPMRGPFNRESGPSGLIGHCMLIIGYDDQQEAFLIQNSFGTGWGHEWNGSGGYIWMGYNLFQYLAQGRAMFITN